MGFLKGNPNLWAFKKETQTFGLSKRKPKPLGFQKGNPNQSYPSMSTKNLLQTALLLIHRIVHERSQIPMQRQMKREPPRALALALARLGAERAQPRGQPLEQERDHPLAQAEQRRLPQMLQKGPHDAGAELELGREGAEVGGLLLHVVAERAHIQVHAFASQEVCHELFANNHYLNFYSDLQHYHIIDI